MSSRSDIAIQVDGLSKAYTISHNVQHDTLVDLITHSFKRKSAENSPAQSSRETFWALKDVSFEIKQGDSVGIIGRNGAGKSTLLKLLSRITEPTSGKAVLKGRVGSLLEVGTGFHPDLTGRENVYLNGTILGMTRSEITRQFDAIVDFSGTEKFLDTPVKRYSSGMYVRLAFAIAAHMSPEILIVDEVLAVGDAEFQKKCLGKMQDVATGGRTVIFVSHSISSVLQLCNRCLYLKDGTLRAEGPAAEIADLYTREGQSGSTERTWTPERAPGNEMARLRAVRVLGPDGKLGEMLQLSHAVTLEMQFEVLQSGYELAPVFHLVNSSGIVVFANAKSDDDSWVRRRYEAGTYTVRCNVPANLLNDGTYDVNAFLIHNLSDVLAQVQSVVSFDLHDDGSGRGGYTGTMIGVLRQSFPWTIEHSPKGML